MQISVGNMIIGSLHLLLLIAVIYVIAFLRIHDSIRLNVADVLLAMVQMLNLTLLLRHIVGYDESYLMANVNDDMLIIAQVLFVLLILIRVIWLLRKLPDDRRKLLMPQSIRETIDYLPGGICFSTPSGRPILTNLKMNELIYRLTNHTIVNALNTWEELRQFETADGIIKLENHWMDREHFGEADDEPMYFSLSDGSVWRFRKKELSDQSPHYVQLEASQITDLYRYSKELHENNKRLAEQYARQQDILANIVEINHEKEILQAKIRIHDNLGHSILITKQHLNTQALAGNIPYLAEMWDNTIRGLSDFAQISASTEASPEIELRRAAEMIGCRINFIGDRPTGRKTTLLLYALVREALTNSVMHAKADQLNVIITPTDQGYHVEISDNGTKHINTLTEGSGLGNLRIKLEQEGATLDLKYEDGLILVAELPADKM